MMSATLGWTDSQEPAPAVTDDGDAAAAPVESAADGRRGDEDEQETAAVGDDVEGEVADKSDRLLSQLMDAVIYDVVLILVLGLPVLILNRPTSPGHSGGGPEGFERAVLPDFGPVATTVPVSAGLSALPPDDAGDLRPDADEILEPWVFRKELRIAAEVALAAWLPTMGLKLLMVLILDDATQHPFLKLITAGPGWQVLALIVFTATVLAPVMEELLFRVVILGGLLHGVRRESMSVGAAIGLSIRSVCLCSWFSRQHRAAATGCDARLDVLPASQLPHGDAGPLTVQRVQPAGGRSGTAVNASRDALAAFNGTVCRDRRGPNPQGRLPASERP